ncbi:class I SAM-dependent methyltransferase [Auraticoccus cholistanensis]
MSWGSGRATGLSEVMDDPGADLVLLERTYGHFRVVNALLAGWRRVYRREIRPRLSPGRTSTLLDVGCGGGDLARRLAGWARADGLLLEVTGVDPDPRAHAWATRLPPVPGVRFERADSASLVRQGRRFDLVMSNHLLHHLDDEQVRDLLADSERLARRAVLHGDLERSRLAWLVWTVLALPFARRSLVHHDGRISIRRSFRAAELARLAPAGWSVRRGVPFRLLLVRDLGAEDDDER